MQPQREKMPWCKSSEFAWCVLLPAAAFSGSKRETKSVRTVLEQMGVSCFSVVFLLSGCTRLFLGCSCKFRLQCEELHSYLCMKAPLAGLVGCYSSLQVSQVTTSPSLTFTFIAWCNISGRGITADHKTNVCLPSESLSWLRN